VGLADSMKDRPGGSTAIMSPVMHSHRILFFAVLAILAAYTVRQIERPFPGGRPWALLATILLFVVFFLSLFANRSHSIPVDALWLRVFIATSYFLMGVWITYLLFSLPVELGATIFSLSLNRFWVPLGLLSLSLGLSLLGLRADLAGPFVKEISIPIKGLPQPLIGMKMAVLSDLHIGRTSRSSFASDVVRKTLALQPDLVAVTGDLADGPVDAIGSQSVPLSQLHAPLGVYFVTGNHEYYSGVEGWLKQVKELGWVNLLNDNRIVSFKGEKILIGGVPDTQGSYFLPEHHPDPRRAIASKEPSGLKILLAHRPATSPEAERAGFDLQLSGHTHGGQFFPWSLLNPVFYNFASGLHRQGKMWVYVTHGTGSWGPPNRFLVPSEITLIRLTAG
jgi:uncharacterized protein